MHPVNTLAKPIKLLIMDVDGVLTDGRLFFDNHGEEIKAFHARDGHGIHLLYQAGLQAALITGRQSQLVTHRANNLNIPQELVYQGYRNKLPAFEDLQAKTGIDPQQMAYIGDDVIDVPVMRKVGLGIAVNDAHSFVKEHAQYTTHANGGQGAAREAIEFILEAQGKLRPLLDQYLQ